MSEAIYLKKLNQYIDLKSFRKKVATYLFVKASASGERDTTIDLDTIAEDLNVDKDDICIHIKEIVEDTEYIFSDLVSICEVHHAKNMKPFVEIVLYSEGICGFSEEDEDSLFENLEEE